MADEDRWSGMCARAKKLRNEGDLDGALELYRKALEITPNHEKLLNLINKIEGHLSNSRASMVHLGEGFYLSKGIYDKLYNYQRNGVLFLFKLFKSRTGGILGDDMGLGKTVQVCSFLAGMFDSQRIKNALIVVPPPLISNWENELTKWTPGLHVAKFHECTKREKERVVDSVKRRGGVCLTSYNTYTTSSDLLSEIRWDYCILDEGHKIKNHQTKTAKSLHSVRCPQRLILTGTPIMNSLKELWSLYDWTHQGQLLGTLKTFTEKFENPIVRARQKDATFEERKLGEAMSSRLNELISPFLLRRLKDTIKMEKSSEDSESNKMPKLTKKNDLICWIKVSDDQEKVYRAFLTSDEVKSLLNSTRSPLVALTMLKKICDHPRLLSNQKCKMLGVSEGVDGLNEGSDDEGDDQATFDIKFIPNHILTKEAGKMSFLFGLLDRLRAEKHKCLVFSQSRRILDIIEKVISEKGYSYCRLDGRVRLMAERQQIIDRFQTKSRYQVFLLTTKVGGVGLTLTAADRVIIYDPSWNPSTDAQAVDRAFRIGQKEDVVIYRLITCGTVEEKIYRRQVYKDSICKKTLQDSKNPFRHFSKQDLFQLFELGDLEYSETQKNLSVMFQGKRNTSKELESHISFLHTLDNFKGISDHDLLFSKDADDDDVAAVNAPQSSQYLDGYVSQALEKLNLESEENRLLSQQLGHYVGGGVLEGKRDVNSKKSSKEGEFPNNLIRSVPRKKYTFPSDDEDENNFEGDNGDGEKDEVGHKDDDDDDDSHHYDDNDDDNHHSDEDEDDRSRGSSHNSSKETTDLTDFSKPKHYKNVGSSSDEDENDDEYNKRSRLHTSRSSKHQVSGYSHHDASSKSINHDDDDSTDENDNNDDNHSTFGEKIKSRLSQKSINNNVSVIPDTDDDDDELKVIEEDGEADDIYIEDTDEEQQGAVGIHSEAGNYASNTTGNSKSRMSFAENLQSQDILEASSNRQRNDSMHNGTRQSESWLVLSSDEEVDPDDYENSKLRDDKNDPSKADDDEGSSDRGDDDGERKSFEDRTSTLNTDASTSRDITGRAKSSNDSTVRDASHITEDYEESDVEDEEYDNDRDDDDDDDGAEEEVEKSNGDVSQGNVDQTSTTNEMHESHSDADDDEEEDKDLCDESKNDVSRTTGKDNSRYTSSRVDETADYANVTADYANEIADYTNRTSEAYKSKNAIEDEETDDEEKSEDSDDEDDADVSHLTENKQANNSQYTASRIDDAANSTNKTDEMFESSRACDEDEGSEDADDKDEDNKNADDKDETNKVTDDEANKDVNDDEEEDELDTKVERKSGARKSVVAVENEEDDDDDDVDEDEDGKEVDGDEEETDDSVDETYMNLLESAKELCHKGEFHEALKQFEEAFGMYDEEEQDEIIPLTIARLKERLGHS